MKIRIPLHLRKRFGENSIFLSFSIRTPHYHIRPCPLEALVDTGSPWLVISPADSKKMNIPIGSLKKPSEYADIRFGGCKFKRLLMEDVRVSVLTKQGRVATINPPFISVLKHTKKHPPSDIDDLPSVVGMDFLRICSLALHYDGLKKEAYLENKNPTI